MSFGSAERLALALFIECAGCASVSTPPAEHPPIDEVSEQGEQAPPAMDDVEAMVRPLVDDSRVHGVTVAVRRGDETAVHAFGSLTPEARLEIGSVTKVYTALLLADAIERREIAEDATIGDVYEGELPGAVASIPLVDLATHHSGLPRLPSMEGSDPQDPYAHFDEAALWVALEAAEVGSPGFAYSNFGAAALGQLIAAHLERPYEALLEERIFEPLAMNDTGFEKDGLVSGHAFYGGGGGPWHLGSFAPAGGIVSTAADQLRFLEAQLSPPDSPLGRAIERSQRALAAADGGRVAHGWMVAPTGARWHNGQTGSFHAFLAFDRSARVAVAVLADTAAMEVDEAGQRLVDALRGQAVEPPSWPPLRQVPAELLARYEGAYQLGEGFVLTIAREDEQLFIQATGQDRFPIYPVGEPHRFELRVTSASGIFELPAEGPASALVWNQGGRVNRAPRVMAP